MFSFTFLDGIIRFSFFFGISKYLTSFKISRLKVKVTVVYVTLSWLFHPLKVKGFISKASNLMHYLSKKDGERTSAMQLMSHVYD